MRRRILIVPDKFKGSLTARAAANAIAKGWRQARPHDDIQIVPMSDGGDGFGEVMGTSVKGLVQKTRTVDAAGRPCMAKWWWDAGNRTAVVESARVIGLAMLPPGRFHPFELDTFGLGALFQAAKDKGARTILVGIGGSATNDAGFGLARALGWCFLNRRGEKLEKWTDLHELAEAKAPCGSSFDNVRVAVDVQNPLLGRHGATRVYGPQKGIRAGDFARAERCLGRLARVMQETTGRNIAAEAGSGAAGGLGFGLRAFLGGALEPGFELFARHSKLTTRLGKADLVITGEGSLDASTLMGKGVGQLARLCEKQKLPCIGLAGVAPVGSRVSPFLQVRALTELTSVNQAKTRAADWLTRLAKEVAVEWPSKSAA